MSREDIAEYIYNDILEVGEHDLIDFEDCENIADYILENYISQADHEAEIKGLELEIKLLKADKVWMKKKLKENVRLARVEVAREVLDMKHTYPRIIATHILNDKKDRLREIILANEI